MAASDLGGKTQGHMALPWIRDYQVIRGLEVVSKFKNELEYLDFARVIEAVEKVERKGEDFLVRTRGNSELEAKAVIVASGTKQTTLKVPGEKEYMMKGLCYSALSYAPLFIDRTVAVIGEGDLAIRSAAELAIIAQKVYLISASNKILSTPLGKKLKTSKNVNVLIGHEVVEFKGDDYARAMILREPGGSTMELTTEGIFIEKGLVPNSQMVADLVDLDEEGRILVDCSNRTNVPGLFAAGDVTSGFAEQVLIAVGEGAKAALSAYEYLLPRL